MEGATEQRRCELCGKAARIYCECDQARLCWECDEGVHSANFLVEKHTRALLCQGCGSATPWKASGRRLGLSFSFCAVCSTSTHVTSFLDGKSSSLGNEMRFPSPESREPEEYYSSEMIGSDYDSDTDADTDTDTDTDSESYEDSDEEEEGENQVVPWSTPASSHAIPPPLSSPSTSENGACVLPLTGLKRRRSFEDTDSEEEASSIHAVRRNIRRGDRAASASSL